MVNGVAFCHAIGHAGKGCGVGVLEWGAWEDIMLLIYWGPCRIVFCFCGPF